MPPGKDAEQYFEEYLDLRGITFEYERTAGGHHPDYWLDMPSGTVVCEVRHVTARLGEGRNPAGAFDAYKPLRKAISRKAAQGKALSGVHSYVVVLWAPGWPADEITVPGTLFGKIQFVMPFDPATGTADQEKMWTSFGRDATLHAAQHTHISAVSIIKRFNPRLRAAQDEVAERLAGRQHDRDTSIAVILEVYGRRADEGLLDDDARQPRLVTFHNVHATMPLPHAVFNGPFDEQFSVAQDRYERVFAGTDVHCLPE